MVGYYNGRVASRTSVSPHPSRTTPSGVLSRRPQGMFFSTAITIPSTSIHPIFPIPMANISSIKDQQQPIQKIP